MITEKNLLIPEDRKNTKPIIGIEQWALCLYMLERTKCTKDIVNNRVEQFRWWDNTPTVFPWKFCSSRCNQRWVEEIVADGNGKSPRWLRKITTWKSLWLHQLHQNLSDLRHMQNFKFIIFRVTTMLGVLSTSYQTCIIIMINENRKVKFWVRWKSLRCTRNSMI